MKYYNHLNTVAGKGLAIHHPVYWKVLQYLMAPNSSNIIARLTSIVTNQLHTYVLLAQSSLPERKWREVVLEACINYGMGFTFHELL